MAFRQELAGFLRAFRAYEARTNARHRAQVMARSLRFPPRGLWELVSDYREGRRPAHS